MPDYPVLRYTWIGPPSARHIDEKKHSSRPDIYGVCHMAKKNKKNPILFYCLAQYRDDFKESFNQYKNISIKTVESILSETSKEKDLKILQEFYKNYNISGNGTHNVPIKCLYVTFKDMFVLYLLQYKGGYCLDTNTYPMTQYHDSPFEAHKIGQVVFVQINGSETQRILEPWFAYSPEKGWHQYCSEQILSHYDTLIYDALDEYIYHLKQISFEEATMFYWRKAGHYAVNGLYDRLDDHLAEAITAYEIDPDICSIKLTDYGIKKISQSSYSQENNLVCSIEEVKIRSDVTQAIPGQNDLRHMQPTIIYSSRASIDVETMKRVDQLIEKANSQPDQKKYLKKKLS